ncbi:hypothetical protein II906_13510 [bacterium]|nr:hypothetical protein [bacterium]
MKRILTALIISFLALCSVNGEEAEQKLRAGTFIRALTTSEISSLMADVDDEVMFLNTQDMFVYETNAIPENTQIYGTIEEVLEPVQGRNGAIKISIYKLITPDKKVYKVKGHVYTENDNYLGGEETASVYYRKVPHYIVGLRPFLKAAPLHVLEQGRHTVIAPGEYIFIILDEDMILK